jgi:hypothetical protein
VKLFQAVVSEEKEVAAAAAAAAAGAGGMFSFDDPMAMFMGGAQENRFVTIRWAGVGAGGMSGWSVCDCVMGCAYAMHAAACCKSYSEQPSRHARQAVCTAAVVFLVSHTLQQADFTVLAPAHDQHLCVCSRASIGNVCW